MATALLVDGPNAGHAIEVDGDSAVYHVMPPMTVSIYPAEPIYVLPEPTVYRFTRIQFFDHMIDVGWSGPEPEPPFDALVAHLLSSGARKALSGREPM